MAGTLWLVGTPIGNLGDLSPRAAETLAAADVVACEDTRRTQALLTHLGIGRKRLVSFFEGNEERRIPGLLEDLRAGRDVVVVTDGGMPGLSDPGFRLVRAAADEGMAVDVVPGPSAAVAALVVSGLPTDRFAFEGFLPRRASARRARLRELAADARTVVVFESPRRLAATLREGAEALGPRRAAVVRELTKVHGEVVRGRLDELARTFAEGEVRGEVVVVIGGAVQGVPSADREDLRERVRALTAEGLSRKEAAARVADEAGVSRREAYEASLADDDAV